VPAIGEELGIDGKRRDADVAGAMVREPVHRIQVIKHDLVEQLGDRLARRESEDGVAEETHGPAGSPLEAARQQAARLDVEERFGPGISEHLIDVNVGREARAGLAMVLQRMRRHVDNPHLVPQAPKRPRHRMALVPLDLGCEAEDDEHLGANLSACPSQCRYRLTRKEAPRAARCLPAFALVSAVKSPSAH